MILAGLQPHASAGPLAPAPIVLPLAILALLIVAGHALLLWRADMPASRRRIRLANSLVMMFGVPVMAYAFAVATPARPGLFEFAWLLAAGVILLVLLLAMLDILNTLRLRVLERIELRRRTREALRRLDHPSLSVTPRPD